MKDLKYLTAYIIPVCALLGIVYQNYWTLFTPFFVFVMVPVFELFLPTDTQNLGADEIEKKSLLHWTDFLLYLNLFIVFGILIATLQTVTTQSLATYEIVGLTFSCGLVLGSNGINVAHELGHRNSKWEQLLGKLLLLPSLYMHFFIEHNFGHHLNAATPEDPATAKFNQPLYAFWCTSIIGQYKSAWRIQLQLLKKAHYSFLSVHNDMLWYTLFQLSYLIGVYLVYGTQGLLVAFFAGVSGFLLLETINYIEHYGLIRHKKNSGRYERVREVHSWNSNHIMGRMLLYELTRHSDHHYRASKKYQLLDYHDISPQLPYGYPTSMVLSLVPPLWFKIMNKRIPKEML